MIKKMILLAVTWVIIARSGAQDQTNDLPHLKGKRVLVYTRNGKGYVHENIPYSVAAIQKLGQERSFRVDTSSNPAIFRDENLKQYDAVIFANTNNEVFDTEAQKLAWMHYIEAGGGFVGIHSASGTERNWTWFKRLLGATFLRHPPFQPFRVQVIDKGHPAVKGLPVSWETRDECYYFKEINPAIHILTVADISGIQENADSKETRPISFGNVFPSSWCHEFDGGKAWYTALGHDKNDYSNPGYLAHILGGLDWVLDKKPLDYSKAYATSLEIEGLW